jgi:NAD(P)-dependent dehydrogenase (short-subunit alcohol dehydrogenase family)
VEAAVTAVTGRFGRLDFAHNNAGVEGAVVPLAEVERADWDRVLSINLTGVWLCMRAEIPAMLERGGGDRQHRLGFRARRSPRWPLHLHRQ